MPDSDFSLFSQNAGQRLSKSSYDADGERVTGHTPETIARAELANAAAYEASLAMKSVWTL